MKKSLVLVLSILSLFICTEKMFAYGLSGSCQVNSGKIYETWTTMDSGGLYHVWATSGSITSSPTRWATAQEISINTSGTSSVTVPLLQIDRTNGHAVIVWEYYDSTSGNNLVAAAVLPSGSSTWTVHSISDVTTENSNKDDVDASIDSSGNILATWSAYNSGTGNYSVRNATYTLNGLSYSWNNSFIVPGGS